MQERVREYRERYKKYLRGQVKWHDLYSIVENATEEDIALFESIREEEFSSYYQEIVIPLREELLELLQFEGMVKGSKYKKKAQELKKKLENNDGLFTIRKSALEEFFKTKIGSNYSTDRKIELTLRLGSLDVSDL